MPPGQGYPPRSKRYTPPKSFSQKSAARQGALRNMNMDLGAGNMGTSPIAVGKQNAAFDKLERINAFDASRTGRATPKVRMMGGMGSGPTYTGPTASAGRSGYAGLVSNSAIRRNARNIGGVNPTVNGNVASRSLGPAAMGRSVPLGLPAAGQSMGSPAGTGYGALVTRGQVVRNAETLAKNRAASSGTSAAARSATGSVGGYAGYAGLANQYLDQPVGSGYAGLATRRDVMMNNLRGSQNRPINPAGGAARGGARGVTTPVSMGPTRNRPSPVGPMGTNPPSSAVRQVADEGRRMRGKGLLIGAGAAVIAGLAYSGRRGDGSSGGRTGMTRY